MKHSPGLIRPSSAPLFWLLLASGVTALYLWQHDWFAPVRDPDTVSYEQLTLPQHSEHDEDIAGERLRLALASTRTLAYPALLEVLAPLTPDYGLIPRIHWLLFTLAVIYFWHAIAVFSGSRWFALAVAAPLTYPTVLPYIGWVMPELMAAAFTLTAFASLLLLLRAPKSVTAWIGLVLGTLLAYHTKPVLQALVMLLPALALILRLFNERRPRVLARWTAAVSVATIAPLLLFCLLRLTLVGQFGLVAFNGYNMVGIAASFLDEKLVASLPDDHRPLAERILEERRQRKRAPYPLGAKMDWWRSQYVGNQWDIAEPAARETVAEEIASGRAPEARLEPINLVIDSKLMALSSAVLRARPDHYREWVLSGLRYGLGQILESRIVRWFIPPLVATLALVLPFLLWRRRAGPLPLASPIHIGGLGRASFAIALVAISFYLANVALIVLVSWPMERYLALARLLLPSALAAVVFALWAKALRGLGAGLRAALRPLEAPLTRVELGLVAVLTLGLAGWWLTDRLFPTWRANPIWQESSERPAGQPAAFYVVRDFWLPTEPKSARLLVQVEEQYHVYLNGVPVGSDRGASDDRPDLYEVGDLMRRHANRLVFELRDLDGRGSLLCRLDAKPVGRKRRTVLSDADWWTEARFHPELLRPRGPLRDPQAVAVVSRQQHRWLRPGIRRPRTADLLAIPTRIYPRRFKSGPRTSAWQSFDPAVGSSRTRVTFDWGSETTGFLNLSFREMPSALVYLGTEPPDPRRDEAQILVQGLSGLNRWIDTRPRRFRYVTVVGRVRVAGAWVDAVEPGWALRLAPDGVPAEDGSPASPPLEELWRRLGSRPAEPGRTHL